jgi:uncharacterized membrane protein (UPF0127 family)
VIKNINKKTILVSKYKVGQNFLDKTFGLLISSNPRSMLFKTRFGIHTFFMKESIDLIVLDKKNRVVGFKINVRPNRIFLWNPQFDTILELPSGTVKKSKTEIGDTLSFILV